MRRFPYFSTRCAIQIVVYIFTGITESVFGALCHTTSYKHNYIWKGYAYERIYTIKYMKMLMMDFCFAFIFFVGGLGFLWVAMAVLGLAL